MGAAGAQCSIVQWVVVYTCSIRHSSKVVKWSLRPFLNNRAFFLGRFVVRVTRKRLNIFPQNFDLNFWCRSQQTDRFDVGLGSIEPKGTVGALAEVCALRSDALVKRFELSQLQKPSIKRNHIYNLYSLLRVWDYDTVLCCCVFTDGCFCVCVPVFSTHQQAKFNMI